MLYSVLSGTRKTWWHFSNGESGIIEYLSIEKVRYHIWRFAEKRMTKYSFGSTHMLQNYVSDHATWVIFIIWKI